MPRQRIYDEEKYAHFVTFSCYHRRRMLDCEPLRDASSIPPQDPFWQPKYHPFNIYSPQKAREKLDYMHKNPVTAGLVDQAVDWKWSSARYYLLQEPSVVPLEWIS